MCRQLLQFQHHLHKVYAYMIQPWLFILQFVTNFFLPVSYSQHFYQILIVQLVSFDLNLQHFLNLYYGGQFYSQIGILDFEDFDCRWISSVRYQRLEVCSFFHHMQDCWDQLLGLFCHILKPIIDRKLLWCQYLRSSEFLPLLQAHARDDNHMGLYFQYENSYRQFSHYYNFLMA